MLHETLLSQKYINQTPLNLKGSHKKIVVMLYLATILFK